MIESNLLRRHLNKFQRAKLVLPLLEIEKVMAIERQSHRDNTALGNISQSRQKRKRKPLSEEKKEKKFVIEANLRRRQLTDFERAEFGLLLMEIETERAKQRHEAQRGTDGKYLPLSSNELSGQARDIVALQIGLSPTTFQRALAIIKKGSEALKAKCRKNHSLLDQVLLKQKIESKRTESKRGKKTISSSTRILVEGTMDSKTIPSSTIFSRQTFAVKCLGLSLDSSDKPGRPAALFSMFCSLEYVVSTRKVFIEYQHI